VIGVGRRRVNNMSTMTIKLEINVSFPKKIATMKIYLKQKHFGRSVWQCQCVRNFLQFLHFTLVVVNGPVGVCNVAPSERTHCVRNLNENHFSWSHL
jgi:hypothetical protein